MTLEEALVSSNPPPLPDFVVYDTISATPLQQNGFIKPSMAFDGEGGGSGGRVMGEEEMLTKRKRRRRRQRRCKNKEEEENQRMTHIAVERNRRRLMNEHLAVLRSLMPPSYIQRGDQASVVGGAIDFVKGLEQLQQSLEAQKRTLQLQKKASTATSSSSSSGGGQNVDENEQNPPFSHFFAYPHQYLRCHTSPPSMPDSQSVVVGRYPSQFDRDSCESPNLDTEKASAAPQDVCQAPNTRALHSSSQCRHHFGIIGSLLHQCQGGRRMQPDHGTRHCSRSAPHPRHVPSRA